MIDPNQPIILVVEGGGLSTGARFVLVLGATLGVSLMGAALYSMGHQEGREEGRAERDALLRRLEDKMHQNGHTAHGART